LDAEFEGFTFPMGSSFESGIGPAGGYVKARCSEFCDIGGLWAVTGE
jgi:hypothetical protein